MSISLRKSILVGAVAVWIIFPTIIFALNVIYDHGNLVNPKHLRDIRGKGMGDDYYSVTQEEWDQYKYSGRIVIQYFEYLLVIPVYFIFNIDSYFYYNGGTILLVLPSFIGISGLYYIFNFKFKDEWN